MEPDVIVEEEVPDSDIELGSLIVPTPRQQQQEKLQEVRPSYSFRKLRSKTFTQRHVYTVDLCKFLELETESKLEELSHTSTDEEILEHLNKIYLRRKKRYESKGLKRHKFMKPTFQIYVEDFKNYRISWHGKSFYDAIQDEAEDMAQNHVNKNIEDSDDTEEPVPKDNHSSNNNKEVDHLIPTTKSRKALKRKPIKQTQIASSPPPVEATFDFPDSPPHSIHDSQSSNTVHGIKRNEDPISPEPLQEIPLPSPDITLPQPPQFTEPEPQFSRRSLRQRKFSQNHVFTVDLCAYLGLLTRSELDSYSESGIADEDIFKKLDNLYEAKRRRHPGQIKEKFKFNSFLTHLEHHTKKYQRRSEAVNPPAETYSSSQIVSSEDEEISEDNEDLVLHQERRRLKGVLPFSYLKMKESETNKKQTLKHKYHHQLEGAGVAKKKKRKVLHPIDNTIVDFLNDDDDDEIAEESTWDFPNSTHNEEIEIHEITSSPDTSNDESDLEMFDMSPNFLFGLAEEDRSSGVNPMLSRPVTSKQKSKPKTHTKQKRNIGISTWSTKSKRIYNRRPIDSRKKPQIQPSIPYTSIALTSDDETDSKNYYQRNSNSIKERIERHLSESPKQLHQRKKKKQQHFYGIAPNLSIHSLSRAPQSYTVQLEADSHKYKVVKQKNYSKENLNPLEPPGIYKIPTETDAVIDESFSSNYEDLHYIHKEESEKLKNFLQDPEDGIHDMISYKLGKSVYVLSKINLSESPVIVKNSFTLFREYLLKSKIGVGEDAIVIVFLEKMAQWLKSTQDTGYHIALNLMPELIRSLKTLIEIMNKVIYSKQQTGNSTLVLISLVMLNLSLCEKILELYGKSQSQIKIFILKLVHCYFGYIFVCETPDSFFKTLSGSDSKYYRSLSLIVMCGEFSMWDEFALSYQKYSNANEVHRTIEYIKLFKIFTTEVNWGPVIEILKTLKKLMGFSQLKSAKGLMNLIFELGWDLDESVIIAVYDLLSFVKFRNFAGERDKLNLKFDYSRVDHSDDNILDSYFRILTIYLSKEKPTNLVERIMPISALDTDSNVVLINRINVLLVYSYLFKTSLIKQLSILLKNTDSLDIAFDSICLLLHINLQNNGKLPLDSIRKCVMNVVDKFNSTLSIRLDSNLIQQNGGQLLTRIITKLSEFLDNNGIKRFDLFKITSELLKIKFHASPSLNKILSSLLSLTRKCLSKLDVLVLNDETCDFLKLEFFETLTTLLSLQLSIYVPLHSNYRIVSHLVEIWCEFSQYLVSKQLIDWNSVLFYHWNNIAGSYQRENFELQLLEKLIDSATMDRAKIDSSEILLIAFSRHIVKFNSKFYNYLTKLIKYYSEDRFVFANSFNFENQEQFDKSRVQVVISYVYYLKKLSMESTVDFKKADMLLSELLKSLAKEFEIQNQNVVNFTWFCHFATKIVKFINYSCFELVKNSVAFSKLRDKLKISYHSDVDYAEKLKTRISESDNSQQIQIIEKEILSSIIQGPDADLKFYDILKSLVVDQLNNNIYNVDSSSLYPFAILVSCHYHILSNKHSIISWFMMNRYLQILNECILLKGSLNAVDLLCLMKMILFISSINELQDESYQVLTKIYELLYIIYNLFGSYRDQEQFLKLVLPFIDNTESGYQDLYKNKDFQHCLSFLEQKLDNTHITDIITNLSKKQSIDQIQIDLELKKNKFKRLINPELSQFIEF